MTMELNLRWELGELEAALLEEKQYTERMYKALERVEYINSTLIEGYEKTDIHQTIQSILIEYKNLI